MSRLQAAIAKAQDTTGSVPNSGWYGASHDFATVEEALKVVERLAELPDDLIVINQKAMDRAAVVPGTDQKVEVAILQGRNSLKGLLPPGKLERFFLKYSIDKNTRPERLAPQDFINLINS